MSPQRKRLAQLLLTERAIFDLMGIEDYSVEKWGTRTATRYLDEIELSLELIRKNPGILRPFEGLPPGIQCYCVNMHVLVCDVRPASVVVLTVLHGSMDIPSRLAELVPQLSAEVALLHERLASGEQR